MEEPGFELRSDSQVWGLNHKVGEVACLPANKPQAASGRGGGEQVSVTENHLDHDGY